jgi:hypothetical protein
MRRPRSSPALQLLFLALVWTQGVAQSGSPSTQSATGHSTLPLVVKFTGNIQHPGGTSPSGPLEVSFAIYSDESGSAPLWLETQSVVADVQGRFTVLLGSTNSLGVPADVFAQGEARWIGFTPDDGVERPRVLLTTVPYAFKAGDANTLGGLGPEEFVTTQQLNSLLNAGSHRSPSPVVSTLWPVPSPGPTPLVGSSFEATSRFGPSFISDATSGAPLAVSSNELVQNLNADLLHGFSDSAFAQLAIANTFVGTQSLSGGLNLPAANLEASSVGLFDSAPLDFASSICPPPFSGGCQTFSQRFRWFSQPVVGTTVAAPSALLSLAFGANGATPTSTGLSINSDGTVNFPAAQQIPVSAVENAFSELQTGAGGVGVAYAPIVNTVTYSWTQTPNSRSPNAPRSGLNPGSNIVTLQPCPQGVNGADVWHYLYVSGTGTPEVVLITGGSCVSGAASGTLEFTASSAHPPGYSIGTATDGVQEAVISAGNSSYETTSRQVMIDPGTHLFRARLSIRASGMTVTSSGATITCAMSDTCIMLGDPASPAPFSQIVLRGLRVAAGVPSGTWPAVEDNAEGSLIDDFAPVNSPVALSSFGSLVQVDNDQAATINRLSSLGPAWSRCDPTFCSTAIVGPGPFGVNAGVLWVTNANLGLGCSANGIDNQNGNTIEILNSVVEAYPQFGIRARTVYSAQTVSMNNVYEEVGGCVNPLDTGMAGLIVEGGSASVYSSVGPNGQFPQFANTGSIQYNYYIVVNSSTMGSSYAYLAGTALTNGSGMINVIWNKVGTAGSITYDVLRTVSNGGTNDQAPYGTGAFAVASGVLATSCSQRVCMITDNAAAVPSQYTVPTTPYYWPALTLWPGSIVLTTVGDYQNTGGGVPTMYFTDSLATGGIVNSAGAFVPSVFAEWCQPQSNWSPISMQCVGGTSNSNDFPPVQGTIMQLSNNGGSPGGLKGRLLFEAPVGTSSLGTHVITLADSNPAKTNATPNNRPSWDANDTYIGYDQSQYQGVAQTQLSFGAPVSISNYIGNPGDGVSFLERLTSSLKTFNLPVTINGNLTVTGGCTGCGGTSGPSVIESAVSAMTPTVPGRSKLGFDSDGQVSVSENGGPVTEVAKKIPQEFTYTFFDSNHALTTSLQVPSVYVNRAAAFHIVEVYCEVDTGLAVINLTEGGSSILLSGLECTPAGASSTIFVEGRDAIAVGTKISHATLSTGTGLHRMNVVVKYLPD